MLGPVASWSLCILSAMEQKERKATEPYAISPRADSGAGPICAYGLSRMLEQPATGHTTWALVSLDHVK